MTPTRILGLLGVLAACFLTGEAGMSAETTPIPVDAKGNLHVPTDYRLLYEFIGSWAISSDNGPGSKQIHAVYASPGAVAEFKKRGRFPEGTVLVKEVYEAGTGAMTTGTVSHATKLAGWFVMVKDERDDHPGNKLWGNGWGWSWFNGGDPMKTTSTDFKSDCLGCHVPAKATDWIYTEGYPALSGQ